MRTANSLLALALLLPACTTRDGGTGEDTDVATDTNITEPTTTDMNPPPAGCECVEGDPCSIPLCAMAAPGDATTCALEALRDGKAGLLEYISVSNEGQFSTSARIELFGDGTVRRSIGETADLCVSTADEIEFGPLRPAAYFTDCLANPDSDARDICVLTSLASVTIACQAGEQNCDGF